MSSRAPEILRRLLAGLLPPGNVRDGLLGDLDERYAERAEAGRAAATVWYAREVLSAAIHYGFRRREAAVTGARGMGMIERLGNDLAFALRALRRRPGFAAVIVLTLALGIGATPAVSSVVRSLPLRPLPPRAGGRL